MNSESVCTVLGSVERALRGALAFSDASLVIYRRGILIEFKTALLRDSFTATRRGSHRDWQIGSFSGHHCHLDLGSVTKVWFDAEPVSCQGGRLNYTVWFLSGGDCGNPYRGNGLFSITLNAPYQTDGSPRLDQIEAVYCLRDSLLQAPGVFASEAFIAVRPLGSVRNSERAIGGRDQVLESIQQAILLDRPQPPTPRKTGRLLDYLTGGSGSDVTRRSKGAE
jgi:hypothetical protein